MAHTKPTATGLKIVQKLITLSDRYEKLVAEESAKRDAGIDPKYFVNTMAYYSKRFGDK